MSGFINCVWLVALSAAFVILLLTKLGVIEWIQINGSEILNKLTRCNFCLSFWVGLSLSLILVLITGSFYLLAIPIFSTAVTRILL